MNFPHQPDQLTAKWFTETLRQAGVLKNASVKSFEVKKLSGIQGALAQNTIITLSYDIVEDDAPRSIFAKFASSDPEHRTTFRNVYMQEVRFYQQFAHRVDFPTPQAYFSAFDEATSYFLLLLADCSDGEIGDRATGCSVDKARPIIREIAKFHAVWWEHPELSQHTWPLNDASSVNRRHGLYRDFVNVLDDIPEIPREPELILTIKEYSTSYVAWTKHLQNSPYTLIHNDYQLDNFIFSRTEGTTKFMVLDWQLMTLGRGAKDVSGFLGGNISIEDRRAHEKDLIKLYHDTLCEHGVRDYSFDQCWDDYRMSMLDNLWRMVLSLGGRNMREAQYAAHRDVIAPRFFTAVVDLNCGEMLKRLT